MAKTNVLHTRIDADTQKNVENILDNLGVNTSTVINMLFKQIEIKNGIPFDLTLPRYNAETEKAIENARNGIGLSKKFNTVDEMINDILEN